MTIAAAVTETVYQIGGTSSLGPYSTVFPCPNGAPLNVWLVYGGTLTQLAASAYTLSGSLPAYNGYNVTLNSSTLQGAASWPAGSVLVLQRATPQAQASALGEAGAFSPQAYEAALDVQEQQLQELSAVVARAVKAQLGDSVGPLPLAAARANMVAAYDGGGNPTVVALNGLTIAPGGLPGVAVIYPSGDTTGATDAAAIQAALNTGADVYLGPGTFYTNATLTATTVASHGQKLYGAGPTSHLGTGTLCTIVRPTAAVSTFFKIDGTSFGGYCENMAVESFTLDMINMADTSSSVGFLQVQAWSARYSRVQVINDGSNKLGWSLAAGAYITLLDSCTSNWLSFVGVSDANQVTTVTVLNHDGNNVTMNYCANMRFLGGAFQGSGTRFTIRNTATVSIETDVEGTGTYLNVDNTVIGLRSFAELQGFTGAYRTGTPGVNSFIFDDIAPYSSYVWSMGSGGFNLNNGGVSGNSRLLSGATGTQYYLGMGRTGLDLVIGVAGATNDFFGYDTAAGDTVITTYAGNMWLGINEAPIVEITSAGINVLGDISATAFGTVVSPTINAKTLYVKPGTDIGSVFAVSTAAGVGVVNVGTSGTPSVALINGSALYGYSDNGSTLKFQINASNGGASFTTLSASSTVSGAGFSTYLASPPAIGGTTPAAITGTTVKGTQGLVVPVFTYATLPASPVQGQRAMITDATTSTFLATVSAGGGSNKVPVMYNGTAWVVA